MTRPNILLFIADQLRADHLGCYGNTVVQTPAIDALAARGTRFDHFYTASPLCMPNRATLLTGRLPSLHGVRRNGIPLSVAERTFVEQLRADGYRTALIGKAHFQPYDTFGHARRATPRPLEARRLPASPDGYEAEYLAHWREDDRHDVPHPYYGFEHTELCLYHGDKVEGDYARWLRRRDPAVEAARGPDHALADPRYICRDAWRTAVPEHLYPSAYIAERAQAWLQANAAQAGAAERPFLLVCSFPDPHHPFTPPGRYWDMYDPADIALPPTFHLPPTYPPIAYLHELCRRQPKLPNNHHPFAPSEREAREAIALTYGSISCIDAAIGRVVDTLQSVGLAGATTVALTSDHGDFMGDHGVMLKGPFHFQGLARVPFVWVDPARPPSSSAPARSVDEVCGTIDIARTLLDQAGTQPSNGMQGRSLLPSLAGTAPPSMESVLLESETGGLTFGRPGNYKLRTLMLRDWRITWSTDAELCELYHLPEDPGETRNLWGEGAYHEVREQLLHQLMQAMVLAAEESPLPMASG